MHSEICILTIKQMECYIYIYIYFRDHENKRKILRNPTLNYGIMVMNQNDWPNVAARFPRIVEHTGKAYTKTQIGFLIAKPSGGVVVVGMGGVVLVGMGGRVRGFRTTYKSCVIRCVKLRTLASPPRVGWRRRFLRVRNG